MPHSNSAPAGPSPCTGTGTCTGTPKVRASNGTARATASASTGESAITWPVPCGSSTASPAPSETGAPPSGSIQQLPSSTTWKPAPSYGAKRVHHVPRTRTRCEDGCPTRTAAIASLTTSMVPA